ncbi:MAG: type II secretion system F family protein [Gemmatales bacterium]|nr:type II secretion system F family protein [Gemmatales bacterium]MDW8386138.1 type II secretion system F family protein [Gemmatales bacterium]
MTMNLLTLILPMLAFLAVVAVFGVVGLMLRSREARGEERLDIYTGQKRQDGAPAVDKVQEIWKEQAFEEDKKNLLDQLLPTLPSIHRIFEQADVNVRPSTLTGISLILLLLGFSLGWLMRIPIYLAPLPGLVLFCVPWCWLWFKRNQRLKQFASQLPDAMELLARALRAGQSLAAGMHIVSEEMPAPIATEFGRVYEEQNLGISMEDSLKAMCERVPNLDLRFFVTAVIIQRTTGGDLAEILDKIGYVIRERFRILGQVKALTGEGRLSGVVLIALCPALFFVVLYLNPAYVELLWTTEFGIKMSVFAIVMQILGAIAIKKIVTIKV